jgi:hypothetical protein
MSAMEHRYGERLHLSLPAIVHMPGGEQVAVTLRNLSTGGAFVGVPDAVAVLHGLVELEFSVPGNDPEVFLWRAWVIRQELDGAGLMFDDRQRAARLPLLGARSVLRAGQCMLRPGTGAK